MELSPSLLWLIAGMVLIGLEVFGVPGIGLLFAGIAALITGVLVESGLMASDNYTMQFACFFVLTGISALLLWKPMQRWRTAPAAAGDYNNMVGDKVVVIGDLARGKTGKARWSGTTMQARLIPDAVVDILPDGADAEIVAVDGNMLILKPIVH